MKENKITAGQAYQEVATKQKTIAQQLNLNVEFDEPFIIRNQNNDIIYKENYRGFWYRSEFDQNHNEIYCENSEGPWYKQEFDQNNNNISYSHSNGNWYKKEYDENNNVIYYENQNGVVEDKRVVELTLDKIASRFGIKVENLKIKK